MNEAPFSFVLSLDELSWLAAAMDLTALPLPAGLYAERSLDERRAAQRRGYQSLLGRGLLRRLENGKHQVEGVLTAALFWMNSAPSAVRLEEVRRDASSRTLSLFALEAEAAFLALELRPPEALFTLFPSRSPLEQYVQDWLALPVGKASAPPAAALPQPLTLIPLLWQDARRGKGVLTEWGVHGAELEEVLNWAAALQRTVVIARRDQGEDEYRDDGALACSDSAAWIGREEGETRFRFTSWQDDWDAFFAEFLPG